MLEGGVARERGDDRVKISIQAWSEMTTHTESEYGLTHEEPYSEVRRYSGCPRLFQQRGYGGTVAR